PSPLQFTAFPTTSLFILFILANETHNFTPVTNIFVCKIPANVDDKLNVLCVAPYLLSSLSHICSYRVDRVTHPQSRTDAFHFSTVYLFYYLYISFTANSSSCIHLDRNSNDVSHKIQTRNIFVSEN